MTDIIIHEELPQFLLPHQFVFTKAKGIKQRLWIHKQRVNIRIRNAQLTWLNVSFELVTDSASVFKALAADVILSERLIHISFSCKSQHRASVLCFGAIQRYWYYDAPSIGEGQRQCAPLNTFSGNTQANWKVRTLFISNKTIFYPFFQRFYVIKLSGEVRQQRLMPTVSTAADEPFLSAALQLALGTFFSRPPSALFPCRAGFPASAGLYVLCSLSPRATALTAPVPSEGWV